MSSRANGFNGVWVYGTITYSTVASGHENVIAGNEIGTDVTGQIPLGNTRYGVELDGSGNTVGGTTAAAGNLIANNFLSGQHGAAGVASSFDFASNDGFDNQITANRIFNNGGPPIDIGADGITENSATPGSGFTDFQNYPVIATTAAGKLEGWLSGSEPNTTFRIDAYASSALRSDGAGEAEDYLGSFEVTTDAHGRVAFDVPFVAPSGLPVITATATDPHGNTSEVSGQRRTDVQAPAGISRLAPGQTTTFSIASDDPLAIEDPDSGPLPVSWNLALSVGTGTLTLASTDGLTGSGDGTGLLQYNGSLAAVNAALAGLTFTAPPQFQGNVTLSMAAQSDLAQSLSAQIAIVVTSGRFDVTTTADSGPGSLRQAILDSDLAQGGRNTINFAIPGQGIQTIALLSPLPAITSSLLLDGSSQPGYAGAPIIQLLGLDPATSSGLSISGSDVTVRGVALGTDDFAFVTGSTAAGVTLSAQPVSASAAGDVDTYKFETSTSNLLTAVVDPLGFTSRLLLLDSQGHVLVTSDGLSPSVPEDTINQDLPAGTYFLKVKSNGNAGMFSMTARLTPATPPFQPIFVGSGASASASADFNGDGFADLVGVNANSGEISVVLGNGDGTFQSERTYATGELPMAVLAADFNGDGKGRSGRRQPVRQRCLDLAGQRRRELSGTASE